MINYHMSLPLLVLPSLKLFSARVWPLTRPVRSVCIARVSARRPNPPPSVVTPTPRPSWCSTRPTSGSTSAARTRSHSDDTGTAVEGGRYRNYSAERLWFFQVSLFNTCFAAKVSLLALRWTLDRRCIEVQRA